MQEEGNHQECDTDTIHMGEGRTSVRHADHADVGDELQFKVEPFILCALAIFSDDRSRVECRFERPVASASAAALAQQRPVPCTLVSVTSTCIVAGKATRHGSDGYGQAMPLVYGRTCCGSVAAC